MSFQDAYNARRGTLDGALALIRDGDCIATSIYGNEPTRFLQNLHHIAPRVKDVRLWTMMMMDHYPVMLDNSLQGSIDILSFFYNADSRKGHDSGRFSFVPLNLHSVAQGTIRAARPTVFCCTVSPMDENGKVYIAFDLEASLEWLECADTVIFEVNKDMPRTCGDTGVSIECATYLYEVDDRPTPCAPPTPASPTERQIAQYVAELIHDGDCIQLGIGGMPGAVGEALMHKRDLGVHTEMITASMGKLIRAGVITNARKNFHPGKCVAAFAWGDPALYALMADNPLFEMKRAAYTNDPFNIAKNDNMVSVNTALQIDLTGQICSESIGSRQYSGTGGASDFAYGAYHAKGGRGIIAISSTAKGGAVSRIVPQLTPGAVVSISRNVADYVITEYGVAPLRDRSVRTRVRNLIAVSHPDFREALRQQAEKLMLW
ncbi:MAG: acetyl-CoA hydrolase/transferase C-terminal domain-containing protein [Oscillospiraceae bacterium]|nr:acetyl-CoA hydrolase/transferase C-terminal domain-containing protein [Oscillospiraceae bacterium]